MSSVEDRLGPLPLLRSSERSTFMRCPQMWYWAYVEGLVPIDEKKTEADFGTLFHVALAEYYIPGTERGPHPAYTWNKIAKDHIAYVKTQDKVDDELIATWEDFYELGLELADAYVDRYNGDPHWDVLDAERRFAVTIPDTRYPPQLRDGKRGYRPICTLVGTFDLCYRDLNDGFVKMVDHKTVARILTHHLSMDSQASTYLAVGTKALRDQKLIGPQETVKGMEYNFILRTKLDDRPRDAQGLAHNKPQKRHYLEALKAANIQPYGYSDEKLAKFSLAELAEETDHAGLTVLGDVSANQEGENFLRFWVPRTPRERQNQIIRISEEAQVMQRMRTHDIPIWKNTNKDCYYCPFFDMCELHEAGEDIDYFKSTVYKQRDPYADHRPNADNSKKVGDGREIER